jgi:hypothetical protein
MQDRQLFEQILGITAPWYVKHPITDATSEGINSRIQWVKYTARGYRNFNNFIDAIYFHCTGLDLLPSPT